MLHSTAIRFFVVLLTAAGSSALPHPSTATSSPNPNFKPLSHRISRRATASDYVTYAVAGINQMQTWYSASTGLYQGNWWPSANAITMLADFQEYFPAQAEPITNTVFPTTLANAPVSSGFTGYINGYYDDELWWALAWIKVYDVTKENQYLAMAAQIFENSKVEWGNATCGGLWWDKAHTSNGAVENELYLTAAAKLANRLPSTPSGFYYLNEAIKAHDWFIQAGFINSANLINNGLNLETCKNDGGIVFTYNQGILLSGLAELTFSTGNKSYTELATTLALAGINSLTNAQGILTEPCEPNACDGDEQQFKGVFGRNVQFLYNRGEGISDTDRATFKGFLQANANAIWADDQVNNQLGLVWSKEGSAVSVETQGSALDAIVGAACVS